MQLSMTSVSFRTSNLGLLQERCAGVAHVPFASPRLRNWHLHLHFGTSSIAGSRDNWVLTLTDLTPSQEKPPCAIEIALSSDNASRVQRRQEALLHPPSSLVLSCRLHCCAPHPHHRLDCKEASCSQVGSQYQEQFLRRRGPVSWGLLLGGMPLGGQSSIPQQSEAWQAGNP